MQIQKSRIVSKRAIIFFAGWTLFAAFAVWLLLHRNSYTPENASSIVSDSDFEEDSMFSRLADWFRLLDLNFRGIYPWLLLSPYVFWLGSHFVLETKHWRSSLPVHLLACTFFAWACHLLTVQTDPGRQLVMTIRTESVSSSPGSPSSSTITRFTNEFRVLANGQNLKLKSLPPELSTPLEDLLSDSLVDGRSGAVTGVRFINVPRLHDVFSKNQNSSQSLSAFLNIFAYAAIVGTSLAFHYYRRSREREGRTVVLEAQLNSARLSALQAQLHPHFLFNALNAISTLLHRDTRAAEDALTSFSELLRMALSQSDRPEVSLREDVEFLKRYVEIQQTRLGDRLKFRSRIPEDLLECQVPAFLLQPLVENAIRHGVESSSDQGLVDVGVQAKVDMLVLTVEDNGPGLPKKVEGRSGGTGIGLRNLRDRLQTLYGSNHKVDFGPRREGGIAVRVEIPLNLRRVKENVDKQIHDSQPLVKL